MYSVLMSVYYKENPEWFRNSLQSIYEQTLPTNDFILVCDGKLTNDLYEVIDEYKVKFGNILNVIQLEKNFGLGVALNHGLAFCKNEIVARMDSDDISLPDRCKKQVELLEKNPKLDIVSGTIYEFDVNSSKIDAIKSLPENHDEIIKYAKRRCPFNHPCVMYKKSAVQNAGGYKDFKWFEDYYLWVRMLANGAKAYNIQEPLLLMRSGQNMYSRRGGKAYLKQMLKFRRYVYKSKFCGFFDYLVSSIGQFIFCVVGNKWRQKLYKILLRSTKGEEINEQNV